MPLPSQGSGEVRLWRRMTLLRLLEGDVGHELWTRKRDEFRGIIRAARQTWATADQTGRRPEVLIECGPVGPWPWDDEEAVL